MIHSGMVSNFCEEHACSQPPLAYLLLVTDSGLRCRSEFVFINPNSKGECGCGESFMTTGSKGSTS
uniref:Uncharacterized protein n=1 Tax=Aegilops tauschii subsp. strangulata TaxID=200361 RepID=A0A453H956_AEGTS